MILRLSCNNYNEANLFGELPKLLKYNNACSLTHLSVPSAALWFSDHCLVHLTLTYRQKLKSAKAIIRTVNMD